MKQQATADNGLAIDPGRWYSTAAVAEMIPGGYGQKTIIEAIEEGILPATRLRPRGHYRISGRDVQAFVERAKGDAGA
jgi:excisionase family DNA binding protein